MAKGKGAQTLAQWVTAVMAMKGLNDAMSVDDAVKMIHETPQERRSKFADQIWSARKQRSKGMKKRNAKKRTTKRVTKRAKNPLSSKWMTVKARKLANGKIQLAIPQR